MTKWYVTAKDWNDEFLRFPGRAKDGETIPPAYPRWTNSVQEAHSFSTREEAEEALKFLAMVERMWHDDRLCVMSEEEVLKKMEGRS